MMNRLFKEGLVSSILGLVIIASSVIGWMFFNEPATDAVIIAGIGSGLLFVKDETIGLKK